MQSKAMAPMILLAYSFLVWVSLEKLYKPCYFLGFGPAKKTRRTLIKSMFHHLIPAEEAGAESCSRFLLPVYLFLALSLQSRVSRWQVLSSFMLLCLTGYNNNTHCTTTLKRVGKRTRRRRKTFQRKDNHNLLADSGWRQETLIIKAKISF